MRRRGPAFYLQLAFTLLVCAFLIVPVALSMLAGLTANYLTGIHSGLTLRWVGEVWDGYRDTIFLSIGISLACLATTLVLGVPAAYVLARRQTALTRALEELMVLPVALPGLATALALIVTYGWARGFRTHWSFILVGHVLFTLPFMIRSVLAVLLAIDLKTLEEGAASLGAGFRRRFLDIVLPNCRSGILAGALMVVTLSMGEFNMTWLLHTPLNKTLPVGLADAYASLRLEIASAYTLVFFVMIVPLLLALQALSSSTRHPGSRAAGEAIRDLGPRVEPHEVPDSRGPALRDGPRLPG
jgi:putative spermidine/putrescine transport system permease protein